MNRRAARLLRPAHRRHLCADEHRADADLRRAAHRQFRPRRISDDRDVRRLGDDEISRPQPVLFHRRDRAGHVPVRGRGAPPDRHAGARQAAPGGRVRDHGVVDPDAECRAHGIVGRSAGRASDPRRTLVHFGPVLCEARVADRLRRRGRVHAGTALHVASDLSGQGDPRHRAGRGGGAADGRSRSPHLPHHLRRRIRAGGSLRLRDDAFVLGLSDGRPQFRADRVRDRRARRHGQHRRGAARRHLHRHRPIAEQLLHRARVRADVLLHAVPAGDDLRPAGLLGRKGEATLGIND